MRRRIGAGLAAVTLLGATAVGGAQPAHAADEAPMLKTAITSDIDNFNPFKTIMLTSTQINRMQYDSLVQWDSDNKETAGLADKWQASPDAKTWTYHIPEDRKWSDGEPLTAQDAAWTFQQIKDKPALRTANGSLVENVASVEATDKQNLKMTLNNAQASNPGAELPIVPQHVWEKMDAATTNNDLSDGKPIVGSGPFVMTKYVKGQTIELKTNPTYYRGAAKIGGITYAYYKNSDAAVQGLKAGEIDLVNGLTPAQFNSLKGQPNIATNNGKGRRYSAVALNPGALDSKGQPMGDGNPALKNPQVREALLASMDNKVLLDKVMNGLGKPGSTQEPPVYPDYFGLAPGTKERTFDPAKSNQLLDAAGYKRGADGKRTDPSGKPLKLRLLGRSTDPTHAQMAEYIKQWMADIGIDIETTMATSTQVNNDSTLGKYDMYFTGWSIGPDPDYQLQINTCGSRPDADGSGATSENNWCEPAFDEVYKAQHAELDKAKRAAEVKKAWSMIYDANVLNVMFYADYLEAYRSDRFSGFTLQPTDGGTITNQNGYWGFYRAAPASANGGKAGEQSGGLGTGAYVGIGVAVLAGVVAAVVLVTRNKKSAEDRE